MSARIKSSVRVVLETMLSEHLVKTGRAQGKTGDSDAARQERAEKSSGEVLAKLEKATKAQQQAWNNAIDLKLKPLQLQVEEFDRQIKSAGKNLPKVKEWEEKRKPVLEQIAKLESNKVRPTHAVSAHGKGTDQTGRVVHGHRADETVTGTPTHVGSDPSNTSGAFTSNQGMLHTLNEAFAQADMVSHHSELEREKLRKAGQSTDGLRSLDQDRFATSMQTGQDLGYTLEARGVPEQAKGRALQPGEIDARAASIERTDNVRNATVVLDPGYLMDDDGKLVLDEKGNPKRVGWNLQTAFAHGNAPLAGSSYGHVGQVKGQVHEQEFALKAKGAELDSTRKTLAEKKDQLAQKYAKLQLAQKLVVDTLPQIRQAEQEIAEHEESRKENKDDLVALEAHFAAIDAAEAGAQKLRELLVHAELGADALVAKLDDISALKEELSTMIDNCYEESDEIPKPLLSAREQDYEVLDKAFQLANSLVEKAEALQTKAKREKQKREREQEVVDENRKLASDADVAKLKKEEEQTGGAVAELEKQALALRKSLFDMGADHEAEHGRSATPPAVEGYDIVAGQYTGGRPAKPPILSGVDERFDPLTAHHLYPWNKIKEDLNKALRAQSEAALKKLFAFGGFKPGKDFWTELAKTPDKRNYAFAADVNVAAQSICWSPRNIFMGPIGEQRSDDPHEGLDETFENGVRTLNAMLAHAMDGQGGISPRLDDAEILTDLATPIFEEKMKELVKLKAKEKNKMKKDITQADIARLTQESKDEVTALMVSEAKAKREQAAIETEKLLKERDELAAARVASIEEEIRQFEARESTVMARLSPDQAREDLEAEEAKKAKASSGYQKLEITRSLVDKEVERRQGLARQLARLRDKLQHAPKPYLQEDWATDKAGMKAQKKT